jgi:hypothetical protein
MAIPKPNKPKSALWRDIEIMSKQGWTKGAKVKTYSRSGDSDGSYDPKTKTIRLNLARIAETARKTGKSPSAVARETFRHEIAHHRADLSKAGSGLTHGDTFQKHNRLLGGAYQKPKPKKSSSRITI